MRLKIFIKRKEYMAGTLIPQCLKLDNIARFIEEKMENIIIIENKKITPIIEMLV